MYRNLTSVHKFWSNYGYWKFQKHLNFSTFNFLISLFGYIYIAPYKTPKNTCLGPGCCWCFVAVLTERSTGHIKRAGEILLRSYGRSSKPAAGRQAGRQAGRLLLLHLLPPIFSPSYCTIDHRPTTTSNGSLFASELPFICISVVFFFFFSHWRNFSSKDENFKN